MLIFGSPKQLQLLFNSSVIFLNGTFQTTPSFLDQHPESAHKGCHFHFNQCIYRRIQLLGLATAYSQVELVRSCCRKLMALPLLPTQEVETSFYNLRAPAHPTVKK
ncbi:unnamed protein product [Rotaria sordida]|uniref:Uncharacterized protein n=1 Tax=Rotaria sordida TaxID=392033 RepID=A0A819J752_9BILA|nr:unnamed protein product [Rotaria sordida]CAF3925691.1 unnamed protein product [Rotaria sordida]